MITCCVCNHPNRPGAKVCANCRAPLMLQDKYRIVRLLGRGGYGAVYQAEHTGLGGASYAIKELNPDPTATPEQQSAASEQFRLEASILAKLNHSALPKVMDFFNEAGRDYLVMEYVEGETLTERLARIAAPLPEAQVLAWAQELCDVLQYLHTRQPNPVIHRDVKPSNIKIAPDGSLKLIDFGIAKLHMAGAGTQGAARAVSPPYSPIEQYGRGTDARSDIYALGVTLYQLLTTHLPPEAPDRAGESTRPLRQLNAALEPNMEAVVMKAMAETATERFQSAAEMKQALTAFQVSSTMPLRQPLAAPTQRAVPAPAMPLPRARSNNLIWVAAILGILLVSVTCCILFGAQAIAQQQAAARTTAQAQAQMTAVADARTTATLRARTTLTAEANTTGTAQARSAAAAQTAAAATTAARSTATAQARTTRSPVFGPVGGTLAYTDNYVSSRLAEVDLRNFIVEVTFYNPYDLSAGKWDYGIGFRRAGANQGYRLVVSSNRGWAVDLGSGLESDGSPKLKRIASGTHDSISILASGSTQLRLIANGATGSLYINNNLVQSLDLSERNTSGDVWIGSGFVQGYSVSGKSTRYENFTVWALP